MTKKVLGKTGLLVSPLGFGGAPIGQLKTAQKNVSQILELLLEAGVNVIDTAECYGESEKLITKAVGHRRNQCIIITKCGHRVPGLRGEEWSASLIGQTLHRALRRLKTDRIDV